MKNSFASTWLLAASSLFFQDFASAQESQGAWGRLGVSYRVGINISADFSGVGGFFSPNTPGGAGTIAGAPGAVARTYDDGFIGVDVGGNSGGSTWFWGYDTPSQISGDALALNNSGSPANLFSADNSDGPQHGFELSYHHPLREREKWSWGIDGAFNWTDISITDNRTLFGTLNTTTHSFGLGGIIPPTAPYSGTSSGPGPIISETASDVSGGPVAGVVPVIGNRGINAELYGFRFGPSVELRPFGDRFSFGLAAGVSLGLLDGDFAYSETVTIAGVGAQSRSGAASDSKFLYGGYLRGQTNCRLTRDVSVFGSAELNHMGGFEQTVGGKSARLDLGSAVFLSGGLRFSF